ncbi:hypothetical protein TPHA_0O01780 [Tetrapisispora phaffii CBS 4417]|uniref:protein-tyrosine-phosphatase n=1 Tax=Tetrapisispora phaffii (strain ATCC 24235 / CBS 4417 / NBRC 1672 / NRRL Y-8282 / UCD 70-5) TaxID=1071381 RepID=G8C1W7_TETPH|nr:hypothetical protein TPHA_0O01780 [Tetrapisispora phaffii CBS 4417]CCE66145.1 hypothetical protein TPHA_0O01780 [Tetrapisispora phaffii CBS 4417]
MVSLPKYLKQSDRELENKFRFIQHQEDARIRDATMDPSNSKWTFGVSIDDSNRYRNRYVNIMPYEKNRVKLNVYNGNDYMNASYVKVNVSGQTMKPGFYIATQGPTERTWDQFWQMCYQNYSENDSNDSVVIVMVTPLVEYNREKCYQYWPRGGSSDSIRIAEKVQDPGEDDVSEFEHALKIEYANSRRYDDCYTLTTMRLVPVDESGEELGPAKTVHHFYFDQWRDMSKPEEVIPIMKLCQHSHSLNKAGNPIIVHCSAGVGRSGTFIALDHMLHDTEDFKIDAEQKMSSGGQMVGSPLHPDKGYDHDLIEQIVLQLRAQRLKMVQMSDQYKFIYHAAKYMYQHPPH